MNIVECNCTLSKCTFHCSFTGVNTTDITLDEAPSSSQCSSISFTTKCLMTSLINKTVNWFFIRVRYFLIYLSIPTNWIFKYSDNPMQNTCISNIEFATVSSRRTLEVMIFGRVHLLAKMLKATLHCGPCIVVNNTYFSVPGLLFKHLCQIIFQKKTDIVCDHTFLQEFDCKRYHTYHL